MLATRRMVFSPITVPWIASRAGWSSIALIYGLGCAAFGVLWHTCAANTADEWGERPRLLPAMNDAERALLRSSGGQSSASSSSGSGQKQQQQEEGLLSVLRNLYSCPAAYGPVIAHVCDCLTVYSLLQWGPTICEASPPPIHSLLALHISDLPTKTCSVLKSSASCMCSRSPSSTNVRTGGNHDVCMVVV